MTGNLNHRNPEFISSFVPVLDFTGEIVRILCFGAINPDLVYHVDRIPVPGDDIRSKRWNISWGGKAANAAAALATWGIETRLAGLVLGADPLGDTVLQRLDRPHLDLSHVERSAATITRHCVVLVTPNGDRTIVCTGYEDATWTSPSDRLLEGVSVLLNDGFGGPAAVAMTEEAKRRDLPVVWLDGPPTEGRMADVVVWSAHERTTDEARALARSGPLVILTAGSAAVRGFREEERFEVTPPSVVVTDSTGAGDVFAAACARGLGLGESPEELMRWASAAAASAASRGRDRGPGTVGEIDELARLG